MSHKIFVSYKYADTQVRPLFRPDDYSRTTARHYVDDLSLRLDENDHIYKGEDDGEDMSQFKDETIESKLRSKIFDSSVTIVLVSKGMRDIWKSENDQWIPWEISYSLKVMTKKDRTSGTNALIAVALPDENSDYSYVVTEYNCVTSWNTRNMFKIIADNMFNRTEKNLIVCDSCRSHHHIGKDHSYVYPVKWDNFIVDINGHISHAKDLQSRLDEFELTKTVT
jgi:hypothetical protein